MKQLLYETRENIIYAVICTVGLVFSSGTIFFIPALLVSLIAYFALVALFFERSAMHRRGAEMNRMLEENIAYENSLEGLPVIIGSRQARKTAPTAAAVTYRPTLVADENVQVDEETRLVEWMDWGEQSLIQQTQ